MFRCIRCTPGRLQLYAVVLDLGLIACLAPLWRMLRYPSRPSERRRSRGGPTALTTAVGAEERRADHSQLEEWTEQAKASRIADLKAFAIKWLQDTGTVVAALVLPYS